MEEKEDPEGDPDAVEQDIVESPLKKRASPQK